jgi:hypothetical protein
MHEAETLGEAVPEQAPEGVVGWGHLELAVVGLDKLSEALLHL